MLVKVMRRRRRMRRRIRRRRPGCSFTRSWGAASRRRTLLETQ